MARYRKPYWQLQHQGKYTIGPPVCVKCGRYLEFTEVKKKVNDCPWLLSGNSHARVTQIVKRCASCDQRRKSE